MKWVDTLLRRRCAIYYFYLLAFGALWLAVAGNASGYVRRTNDAGVPLQRDKVSAVQFEIDQKAAPGLKNADGALFITADSNPAAALRAAAATWNGVSSSVARFLPVGTTSNAYNIEDNINEFVFEDTPDIRSAIAGAIAVTVTRFFGSTTNIVESDILFNPNLIDATTGQHFPLSTTLAAGTIDIQSTATHELGHALGASHSGLLNATMFQSLEDGSGFPRKLSEDDIAFVTDAYPSASANQIFGSITGSLAFSSGGPVKGALVVAIEPTQGIAVGGLTGLVDGTYTIKGLRPGKYQVYAEPLTGAVRASNLYLKDSQVDTGFLMGFAGGTDTPRTISVSTGASSKVDFSVPVGTSPLSLLYTGLGIEGGSGDVEELSLFAKTLTAGKAVDLLLFGTGLDSTFTESDIRILGPGVTVRPGSVRLDQQVSANGIHPLRMTLDVAARSSRAACSLILAKGSETAAVSGALLAVPPPPSFTQDGVVSGASFLGGGVAPGEIVSIFGTNLGPTNGVQNGGYDQATGSLPGSLAGVWVLFDGVPGPLFFVRNDQINVQVPVEVAGRASTNVQVVVDGFVNTPADGPNPPAPGPVAVPVVSHHPGIFAYPGGSRAVVVNVTDKGQSFNSASNPAARGSVIVFYGTGPGMSSPPVATGKPASSDPAHLNLVPGLTAQIGGKNATVQFAGMAPGFVGLLQVNAVVPNDAPTGNSQPLSIQVGGVASQPDIGLAVK